MSSVTTHCQDISWFHTIDWVQDDVNVQGIVFFSFLNMLSTGKFEYFRFREWRVDPSTSNFQLPTSNLSHIMTVSKWGLWIGCPANSLPTESQRSSSLIRVGNHQSSAYTSPFFFFSCWWILRPKTRILWCTSWKNVSKQRKISRHKKKPKGKTSWKDIHQLGHQVVRMTSNAMMVRPTFPYNAVKCHCWASFAASHLMTLPRAHLPRCRPMCHYRCRWMSRRNRWRRRPWRIEGEIHDHHDPQVEIYWMPRKTWGKFFKSYRRDHPLEVLSDLQGSQQNYFLVGRGSPELKQSMYNVNIYIYMF